MAVYLKTLPADIRMDIQEFTCFDSRTPAFARHLRKTIPGKNKCLKSIEKIRKTSLIKDEEQVQTKLWVKGSRGYDITMCRACGNYILCEALSTSQGGRFGRRFGLANNACCWCPESLIYY